jgi:hypothetical protein
VETVAPVAPAYVYYEGERYALVQKDNVRQSTRHVAVKLFDSDFDFIESPSQPSQLEFSAVSERMNDVEIDTVGSRCEVRPLRAHCLPGPLTYHRSRVMIQHPRLLGQSSFGTVIT